MNENPFLSAGTIRRKLLGMPCTIRPRFGGEITLLPDCSKNFIDWNPDCRGLILIALNFHALFHTKATIALKAFCQIILSNRITCVRSGYHRWMHSRAMQSEIELELRKRCWMELHSKLNWKVNISVLVSIQQRLLFMPWRRQKRENFKLMWIYDEDDRFSLL